MSAVAQLSSGIVATHLANWLSPFKERITTVTGELGCFVADTLTTDITILPKRPDHLVMPYRSRSRS